MQDRMLHFALLAIRLAVGAILLFGSLHLALVPAAAHHYLHLGLPAWTRLPLAWSEAGASALYMLPWTASLGAALLLVVLGAAVGMHMALDKLQWMLFVYIGLVLLQILFRRTPPSD